MTPETVLSLLEGGDPGATAVVIPDGGALTYAEVRERAGAVAAALSAAGIRHGDRVALSEPDGPAFLELLFGVLAAGATAAPLNSAYTEDEFAFYLDDLKPRALLLPDGGLPAARAAAAATGVEVMAVDAAGDARAELPEVAPDDMALLLHTSGTTSRPKQVPLLHRNLAASARTIAAHYALTADDVAYCAMPLFHVHGLVASVLATLSSGGTVVVPRRFTPRGLLAELEPHGVTWVSAGPTTYSMVLERDEKSGAAATAPRLRFLRSCSSALPEALMAKVESRFGVPLVEAYGMTECSHQLASNPLPPAARKPGSVGRPTGTEIRIAAPGGTDFLAQGEQGEVCVRGPGITGGYLGNPEANAASFFDGWFRTGDLGTIDEEGYVRLEGRIKELVIRGGENISPYEVETALLSHPAVREAACFGLPSEKYGEEVAAVVAVEGVTADELLAHCRDRLAAFKVPTSLTIVEAIPRTATGKLQRQRLPAMLGLT